MQLSGVRPSVCLLQKISLHILRSAWFCELARVVKYFPAEKTAGELSSCESFLRCNALIVSFLCILSYPLRRFPGGPVTHAAWCVCLGQWRSNGVGRVHKVHGAPSSRQKNNNFPITVKIRTSGYQTLKCFIATLPT